MKNTLKYLLALVCLSFATIELPAQLYMDMFTGLHPSLLDDSGGTVL